MGLAGSRCYSPGWIDGANAPVFGDIFYMERRCLNQVNIGTMGLFKPGELLSLLKSVFVKHRIIIFAVDLLSKHLIKYRYGITFRKWQH